MRLPGKPRNGSPAALEISAPQTQSAACVALSRCSSPAAPAFDALATGQINPFHVILRELMRKYWVKMISLGGFLYGPLFSRVLPAP